jgi:leader peptidase (prepilin peptidase) / N-methyltransferase
LNLLADSLPVFRQISAPKCDQCGNVIPFMPYVLGRDCPECNAKASHHIRRWFLQIGYPLAATGLWYFPPGRLGFWVGIVLLAYFILVATIDLEHRLILHPVSFLGALAGLILGIWQKDLLTTLLGAVAGFAIMLGLYYFGILFSKVASRIKGQQLDEEALGYGDVILSGVMGLMLGWPEIIGGLLTAIILGGITSGLILLIMKIFHRYKPLTAIPYAPFLLLGAVVFLYIPKQ